MPFTYSNPLWPGYFADPFILKVGDDYYAYGTGATLDTDSEGNPRAFTILRSRDLVSWQHLGGALIPPDGSEADSFWAPEVVAQHGRFNLYYSSAPPAHDELHRIRVAVADRPEGPFEFHGMVLPEEVGFSIDAHPFRDPRTGRWYLFFAKDFFDERTGTGIAVAPLSPDLRFVSAPARTVLRANSEWQIYERNRTLYGRSWPVWHTVEGPFVVVHDNRYYCFYSGGNWQTCDYGVSYAVADDPLGPWVHAPGWGPVVLRERAPDMLGPGHNSYTIAPDGKTELLVYHAWDAAHSARRMCVDPLVWTTHGPCCAGPTTGARTIA